jgi:hypothetical protein
MWEIPHSTLGDLATAIADRILLIGTWLGEFGDLERCKKLGERISNWLNVTTNGVGYDSPLAVRYQPRLNDAMHPHDIEQIHRVGCVNELILLAALGETTKSELVDAISNMPTRFHFFALQDWEQEYRLADDSAHTEPVAREAFEKRYQALLSDRDFPIKHLGLDPNLATRASPFPEEIHADSSNDGRSGSSDGGNVNGLGGDSKCETRGKTRKRIGRLPKGEKAILRAQFMATIREHPTMKDTPGVLALSLGMSESTVRRWINEEWETYARLSRRDDAE